VYELRPAAGWNAAVPTNLQSYMIQAQNNPPRTESISCPCTRARNASVSPSLDKIVSEASEIPTHVTALVPTETASSSSTEVKYIERRDNEQLSIKRARTQ